MFLKYKVDIPVVPGKLVRKNRGGHTYIEYEYDRIYDPVKQYFLHGLKVFIQFIALILRSRIYTALKEKSEKMLKKPNYLTVPAALKELEKIVMIRQLDGVYRLDHAVTATQKIILDAFGLNEGNVRYQAKEIGNVLQNQ